MSITCWKRVAEALRAGIETEIETWQGYRRR